MAGIHNRPSRRTGVSVSLGPTLALVVRIPGKGGELADYRWCPQGECPSQETQEAFPVAFQVSIEKTRRLRAWAGLLARSP